MPRKKLPPAPKDSEGDALAEVLDALDEVHARCIALGQAAGLEPQETSELTFDDGDRLPQTVFEVGQTASEPEIGGCAFETRVTLSVNYEQAEALAFELLRAIRERTDEIEIDLDGTWIIDKKSARDVKRALDESR